MLTGPSDTHLVGISHDSTLLAVSVLTDRMQQLPDQDRDDLVELFKAICTAKQQGDSEGLESATLAVQEILEQGESGMQRIAPAATPPESIGPWIHWISGKIRT